MSASSYINFFVLKGSYLFPIWSGDVIRSAIDLDLHYLNGSITGDQIILDLINIVSAASPLEDLAEFSTTDMRLQLLPPDTGQLVRASFRVSFGKSQFDIRIDVSTGELLSPGYDSAWYPSLMPSFSSFKLNCCTRDTMVAEKLALTVEFGADNTRVRDYFDLWYLITHFFFLAHNVQLAIIRTLSSRETCTRLLQNESYWLGAYQENFATPLNERHWLACLNSADRSITAPSFQEALGLIRAFAEPVLIAVRDCQPIDGTWAPKQGWRVSERAHKPKTIRHISLAPVNSLRPH